MQNKPQVTSKAENGVMTIIIDNPEMKNGLNWAGIHQLADCYEQMNSDPSIRVAVITGNDEYFYTGGRVDPSVPGESEKYADAIARYTKVCGENKVPLVAAVSGHCMKAGMGLLASSDFAVAREGVTFSYPEVRMGGVPMMVVAETIETMPQKRALEAYLTSWDISDKDAYMMGLVNRVVPKEDFWPMVQKFVRVYLDTPAYILEMTRRAYYEMLKLPDRASRTAYADHMLRCEVLTAMSKSETEYNV